MKVTDKISDGLDGVGHCIVEFPEQWSISLFQNDLPAAVDAQLPPLRCRRVTHSIVHFRWLESEWDSSEVKADTEINILPAAQRFVEPTDLLYRRASDC